MKFGTFHLMTRPDGASSQQVVQETLAEAELAEKLGFDRVWLTEHHASDHGICSVPSVFAAAVAARTSRIGIGYAVNVAPLHHPLRLAEELAMVDQLSGGRVVAGFGPGYSAYEYARYGVELHERYERHNEVVDIICRAWRGERFDYEGKHYQYRDAYVQPEPLQTPRPPVAVTAGSVEGARYAARAGFRLLTLGGLAKVREIVDEYGAELRRGNHPPELVEENLAKVGVLRHIYVDETDEKAQSAVRAPTEFLLRRLDKLTTVEGEGTGATFEEGFAQELEAYVSSRVIAGGPERVVEELVQLAELGCGEVLCWFRWGAMESVEARASMARCAAEVVPRCA